MKLGCMCRFQHATLPRDMMLSAARPESEFDFQWVSDVPKGHDGQENAAGKDNAVTDMPRVQHGHVQSPAWEGRGQAHTDFPSDPLGRHSPDMSSYSRAYTDR